MEKVTATVIAKYEKGEKLSHEELKIAHRFYKELEKYLSVCGPKYESAWKKAVTAKDDLKRKREESNKRVEDEYQKDCFA